MAEDFGDDSGEKMLDNFSRFAERAGVEAMRARADAISRACEHAKASASEKGAPWNEPTEWAKLDMHEFREIEGYDELKPIIDAKLDAHGADHAWFQDERAGKEYLLFRIKDAQEVWDSFDELSHESTEAKERASEAAKRDIDRSRAKKRDERPLDERADAARRASKELEREGGARSREHARGHRARKDRSR